MVDTLSDEGWVSLLVLIQLLIQLFLALYTPSD